MDSEDDGIPFLRFYNENPGSCLLQNGYELHDTLPVESIFTEIETPGTWQTECFSVLVNGPSFNDNESSEISRNVNDKNTLHHTVFKDLDLNENTIIPQSLSPGNEDVLKNNDMVQKLSITASEARHSVLIPESSLFQLNSETANQINDQKRNILLHANGTSYAISYSFNESINSSKNQHHHEKKSLYESDFEDTIKEDEMQVLSSEPEIEEINQNGSTDQLYFVETENVDEISPDSDISLWQDFYSILTAIKCKVCSFLCERIEDMSEHLKKSHGDLIKMKQAAERENEIITKINGKKMKSLLNTNNRFPNNKNGNNMTLFICSLCSKIFSTREILMDHIVKVHNESKSGHSETSATTESEPLNVTTKTAMRNLATSLLKKQKKAMGKVKCSVTGCCLKFANNDIRARHEECHVGDKKQLQCPVCKEKFSIWRVCSKHLWTSHKIDAGLYTCPLCNKYKSNSPVVVMNHMDIHNFEKPFICTECGKGFKQLTQLRNHAVIHKKDDEVPAWSLSRKCSICERYFANPKSLKKHIQSVHEQFKPYICNICGHKTTRKAMLELHIRQHTGDKPYHCPHCIYKTGDHNCLRRHIMWHYGSMKYFCPHCKYQSIQSSAYKNHLANRHPDAEGTFKCNICPFTTVNSDSYLTHVKIHELAQKTENRKHENESKSHDLPEKQTNSSISEIVNIPDDDESLVYLHLTDNGDYSEEIVDTGGVTIPAGYEMQLAQ